FLLYLSVSCLLSSLNIPPPLCSTLFPYTTLFRSICRGAQGWAVALQSRHTFLRLLPRLRQAGRNGQHPLYRAPRQITVTSWILTDRKSTRLNSSHRTISYAVFCLKKKKKT